MAKNILNLVLFQIGWFACVLGAANQVPMVGLSVAIAVLMVHLLAVQKRTEEVIMISVITLIGFSWDSLLVFTGSIVYSASTFSTIAPLWIAAIWAIFATTLNFSMNWLKTRYLIASLLGALFGPTAYFSAFKLGAVSVISLEALVSQSIAWTLFMPAMIWFSQRLTVKNRNLHWEAQ